MSPRRLLLPLLAVAMAAPFLAGGAPAPAPTVSGVTDTVADLLAYGFQGEGEARVDDLDARGSAAPSPAARAAASLLDADVRWNELGTPRVIAPRDGWLSAPVAGDAVDVARGWVDQHRTLFGLTAAQVVDLEVVQDSPLYESPDWRRIAGGEAPEATDVPHVVRFEQTIGGLRTLRDGDLVVGVAADGRVGWVSSSVAPTDELAGSRTLAPVEALQVAAGDVGLALGSLTTLVGEVAPLTRGFLEFGSSLLDDVQRVRPAALPVPGGPARRAWEVTLLDGRPDADGYGNPVAFTTLVDAETGRIWTRRNAVQHQEDPGIPIPQPFTGSVAPGQECGTGHTFAVGAGVTQVVVGASELTLGDIVLRLSTGGAVVATSDLLTSPELLTYAPTGGVAPGDYTVRVCRFEPTDTAPLTYLGTFATSTLDLPTGLQQPSWRAFEGNPNLPSSGNASEDVRAKLCWTVPAGVDDCDQDVSNLASRAAWDTTLGLVPSFTTDGNNASTAISNASFLTPDTLFQRPVALDRQYDFTFDNTWNENACNPTSYLEPGSGDELVNGNDDFASVTNLFVGHNRMHDWAYLLGFTEVNSTMQQNNFGLTEPTRQNDPELGSAQAGRLTSNGRDNANQVTLPDGIPGITNQYLWQPLASAFYAPCTDGAFDFSIYAHEYMHAVSNRMTAGPDGSLTGFQSSSMGESWSDLGAVEIQLEFGVAPPGLEWTVGAYATGDEVRGIRNYQVDETPLHYGSIGYDVTGDEFHADGEIWNGVQYEVRRALVDAWDPTFPSSDQAAQVACARGERDSQVCPGNRRWVQLLSDGFLLQPGSASMVDARDAILAADLLRYDGANQRELWSAFARTGLGVGAETTGADDTEPTADFSSPFARNGRLRFAAVDAGQGVPANLEVYVGQHEARIDPLADTDPSTDLDDAALLAPGTYRMLARADGFGVRRFAVTVEPGADAVVRVPMRRNLASTASGATVAGDGVNLEALVDDTEATNWASLTGEGTASAGKGEGAQVEGRQVTVTLPRRSAVTDVAVSAMTRPVSEDPEDPDTEAQNRFTMLRSFDLLTCDATTGADCDGGSGWTRVLRSSDDAFPATRPRPRVPDAQLRPFDVADSSATHVRLVVRDNQCTGGPDYQDATNPDDDPLNDPDCDATSPNAEIVRAAELQVFGGALPPVTTDGPGVDTPDLPDPSDPTPTEPGPGPGAPGELDLVRLAGTDRYETAAAASRDAFPSAGSAPAVVLARGDDPQGFADALAGTPLAHALGGPLLLTAPTSLPDATAEELARVLPRGATVTVLGREAAVSDEVARAVADLGYEVARVGGTDRYATAVAIAGELGDPATALLAVGTNWPDALAAGAAAIEAGGAVLLTGDGRRVAATDAWLDAHGPTTTFAVGGPAARAYPEARPLVGAGRELTALAVAEEVFDAPATLGVARRDRFPDALAGGLHVGARGGPILLTPTASAFPEVAAYVCRVRDGITTEPAGHVYGGEAAVTEAVRTELARRLAGDGC